MGWNKNKSTGGLSTFDNAKGILNFPFCNVAIAVEL